MCELQCVRFEEKCENFSMKVSVSEAFQFFIVAKRNLLLLNLRLVKGVSLYITRI